MMIDFKQKIERSEDQKIRSLAMAAALSILALLVVGQGMM
jgi:hypothetical protein